MIVEKYGADAVIEAVPIVRKRRRGRPSRGNLPIYEKMHLAQWIDERAEEYLTAGCKAPIRQARIDAYHLEFGSEQQPNEEHLDTIKKKHLEGRGYLRAYLSALERQTAKGRK
jgi:hypothetical protein